VTLPTKRAKIIVCLALTQAVMLAAQAPFLLLTLDLNLGSDSRDLDLDQSGIDEKYYDSSGKPT